MKKERVALLEEIIRDPQEAMYKLQGETEVALDLETSGLSPWRDVIAVVSMYGAKSGETAVLHIRGDMSPELRKWLGRDSVTWVGHNVAGFDMLFLHNAGVRVFETRYFDTLIAEQVALTTNRRDVRVNLQDTIERRLGIHLKKGQGESSWMARDLTTEQWQYCASDVFYLLDLKREHLAKVAGEPQERAMEFEQNLIPIIVRMVLNGVPLDKPALEAWRKQMVIDATDANTRIQHVRPGLNVNSAKQLGDTFLSVFDFELPRTKKGNWKTDKATLIDIVMGAEDLADSPEELSDLGLFTKAIAVAKTERKRGTFYDDDWVVEHVMPDGRVHPRFWQAGTDTFRFSSSNPNMQQVPREGRAIFGGLYGHQMVAVDFSQLEVRVAASIFDDQDLIQALESTDMHTTVASGIFGLPFDSITKEQRRLAKAATFVLLFGGGIARLIAYAKTNGSRLSEEQAKDIYTGFYRQFKGLARGKAQASTLGKQGRPVVLSLASGAKRVLMPHTDGDGPAIVWATQILNTMVQSSAAIGMKHAIYEAHKDGLTEFMALTVHDELVGCVPDALVEEYTATKEAAMIRGMRAITGDTPIRVERKVDFHWRS